MLPPSPDARWRMRRGRCSRRARCRRARCSAAASKGTPDNEPTLKTLAGRKVDGRQGRTSSPSTRRRRSTPIASSSTSRPQAPQRSRRCAAIGDLEMDQRRQQEQRHRQRGARLQGGDRPLQRLPQDLPERPGQRPRALPDGAAPTSRAATSNRRSKTLDRLVKDYPLRRASATRPSSAAASCCSPPRTMPNAEKAFATVLAGGPTSAVPRPLALHAGLVAVQAGPARGRRCARSSPCSTSRSPARRAKAGIETLAGLSRADRELVEDTFRVTSISLAQPARAPSRSPTFIGDSPARQSYEFRRLRAARRALHPARSAPRTRPTPSACSRGCSPLHAQAPVLQARVIEIYEKTGFANLALEAKQGIRRPLRRRQRVPPRQPRGLGQGAAAGQDPPRRAGAPLSRERAEDQGQRRLPGGGALVPRVPGLVPRRTRRRAQNNFLLAELLFEDKRFAEAAVEYEKTAYGYPAHAKSADAGLRARCSAYAQQQKKAPPRPRCRRCSARSVASALRFATACPADPRAGPVLTDAAEKLYALKRRRPGGGGRAAGDRPAAAGRRRAAPRRLDRARPTPRSRQARVRPRREAATPRCSS